MLKLVSLNSNALMLVLLAASLMGAPALAEDTPSTDAKAQEVAEKLMKALGGQANWDKARYLRFDFVVEREGKVASTVKHLWDRYSGRYRVEGTTGEKEAYVVLFEDINARKGRGFSQRQSRQGEDLQKLLDMGYGRFINDTYWLLMPFKWNDPGVHLKYEGTATDKDTVWDKVRLSFEADVGPHTQRPLLGLRQSQDRLDGSLGIHPERRKGSGNRFCLGRVERVRGHHAGPGENFHGRPLRILFQSLKVSAATDEKPFTSLEAHL